MNKEQAFATLDNLTIAMETLENIIEQSGDNEISELEQTLALMKTDFCELYEVYGLAWEAEIESKIQELHQKREEVEK